VRSLASADRTRFPRSEPRDRFRPPAASRRSDCIGDVAIAPIPLRANRSALLVSPQMQADESGLAERSAWDHRQVLVGPSRHLRVRREERRAGERPQARFMPLLKTGPRKSAGPRCRSLWQGMGKCPPVPTSLSQRRKASPDIVEGMSDTYRDLPWRPTCATGTLTTTAGAGVMWLRQPFADASPADF
jgi:hypothetical protein